MADPRDPLSSLRRPKHRAPLQMTDPAREEAELREYLGSAYDHRRLVDYEGQLERELERIGDEQALYRTSEAYLYNLTAFAMTGTKAPYLRDLVALAPGPRLLDYGCGIGSDGLALAEQGYRVEFADFANPSVEYLRWRLARRGLADAPIHDLDRRPPAGGFDAVFAFDVIEHVDDPFALLARLEEQARLVVVNFLESEPGETRLHRELPVAELIAYARARGLRRHRCYHGRSHLVAYAPRETGRGGLAGRLCRPTR